MVYDGDLFAFSHHGTDPAGGQLCNAFDLVRLHKFGIRDEDALPDTPVHKLPSYLEMQRWALTVDDVKIELSRTKKVEAAEDFSGDLEDEDAWRARLTYTDKGGAQQTIHNSVLILQNDPAPGSAENQSGFGLDGQPMTVLFYLIQLVTVGIVSHR